jgi:predicted ATPase
LRRVLKSGVPQRALGVVEEALGYIEVSANRLYEAEAHRLKGACLVALTEGNAGEAEQWFKSGIAIAKRQGALSLALRGATSLAALWGSHGRRAAARELLAPVYGGFTEGYDTPDLKDAKTLLDELSG